MTGTPRVLFCASLLTLWSGTAMAQRGIAYALVNDGTAATVTATYSLNPSGQTITAVRGSVGSYTVTFPGSGIGAGWNIQVAAYGTDAKHCKVVSWAGGAVNVNCFDAPGAAADSPFTVLAIASTNDKNISFALADQPSNAFYSPSSTYAYNSSGGAITIVRSSPGTYQVTFNGLNDSFGGALQVTAYSTGNSYCTQYGWNSGTPPVANVNCHNAAGVLTDSSFDIAIIPRAAQPGGIAYSLALSASESSYQPNPNYTYNPGGAVDITRSSTGRYSVSLKGINAAQISGGIVRVTAFNTNYRCSVSSWTSGASAGELVVNLACNTPAGVAADSNYQLLVIPPLSGLSFFPLTPCRVVDTRNAAGPLGGPSLAGGATRTFPVPSSACGIPATAAAYSFNATVVPKTPTLGFLTLWPTGSSQPGVSTLNSPDGAIIANAAIVPAGASGAINAFALQDSDFVLDINGYFATPGTATLAFYPLAPCRVIDTRNGAGLFGGPFLTGGAARSFPMQLGSCSIPAAAQAYSLNVTVVPRGPLGFLTAWPSGQTQPNASTLNSPDGTVRANAAIVPAGTPNGAVSFFATNDTDLVVDVNGYFGPPGLGNLYFYPVSPCRAVDTRNSNGSLSGPIMGGGTSRSFPLPSSTCALPNNAGAYSLNTTVVPSGPLGFLTLWPTGLTQPLVSTLNDPKGIVTANAALVPAGADGAVSVFVLQNSHVILDTNGFFAQ